MQHNVLHFIIDIITKCLVRQQDTYTVFHAAHTIRVIEHICVILQYIVLDKESQDIIDVKQELHQYAHTDLCLRLK